MLVGYVKQPVFVVLVVRKLALAISVSNQPADGDLSQQEQSFVGRGRGCDKLWLAGADVG